MILIKAVVDFLVVLLLVRLLIRPVEVNFNQIYSLIYRITDPILKPSKVIIRDDFKSVLLSVFGLVVIRGLLYITTNRFTLLSGVAASFLNLFQMLFQFYMAVWFITILSGDRTHTFIISILQRAFLPLGSLASRLGIPRKSFSYFAFAVIISIYSLLSFLLHSIITVSPAFHISHGIIEGLTLILQLFTGFFSMIIIIGALLSWVSPDPHNPVVQTVYGISEPLLFPFRKIIPTIGGLDISPIAAILCFQIVGGLLKQMIDNISRFI